MSQLDLDHVDALLAQQREAHARDECDAACEFCDPAVCAFREIVECKASEVRDISPWRSPEGFGSPPAIERAKRQQTAPKPLSKRQARIKKEMDRDRRLHERHCR